jgi:hypothetical protein
MKPPPQEPTCDCCGAPVPALRWDGTYRPVIEGMWCAWCREPIPASRMRWNPDQYREIMHAAVLSSHWAMHPNGGITLAVYGVRVGV